MINNFYIDRVFLEICKVCAKHQLNTEESTLSSKVFITPDGIVYYTNLYFAIKYKLPKEIVGLQKGLFESLEENKSSILDDTVAILGEEFAKVCTLKSSDDDTGMFATVSQKNDKVLFNWISTFSEQKTYICKFPIEKPPIETLFNKDKNLSPKVIIDSDYLSDTSSLIKKFRKIKKTDDHPMITIYENKMIGMVLEDISIIIMGRIN